MKIFEGDKPADDDEGPSVPTDGDCLSPNACEVVVLNAPLRVVANMMRMERAVTILLKDCSGVPQKSYSVCVFFP